MRSSRIVAQCLLSLALLHLNSCQPSKRANENDRTTISVKDFRGKELHFTRPPERIVCLIESALSGLYMLGAESRVIGVSSNVYQEPLYAWYAAMDARIRAKQLPVPGNWDFVSIESIVALQPDLVILWSQQTESISALEERGIAVFGVFINSREDVYREMLMLGQLTGTGKPGRENWWMIHEENWRLLSGGLLHCLPRAVPVFTSCGRRATWRPPAATAR